MKIVFLIWKKKKKKKTLRYQFLVGQFVLKYADF